MPHSDALTHRVWGASLAHVARPRGRKARGAALLRMPVLVHTGRLACGAQGRPSRRAHASVRTEGLLAAAPGVPPNASLRVALGRPSRPDASDAGERPTQPSTSRLGRARAAQLRMSLRGLGALGRPRSACGPLRGRLGRARATQTKRCVMRTLARQGGLQRACLVADLAGEEGQRFNGLHALALLRGARDLKDAPGAARSSR